MFMKKTSNSKSSTSSFVFQRLCHGAIRKFCGMHARCEKFQFCGPNVDGIGTLAGREEERRKELEQFFFSSPPGCARVPLALRLVHEPW